MLCCFRTVLQFLSRKLSIVHLAISVTHEVIKSRSNVSHKEIMPYLVVNNFPKNAVHQNKNVVVIIFQTEVFLLIIQVTNF